MRTRTALLTTLLALALPAPALAATITVTPGESIQKAVKHADAGDTIKVKPGIYKEQSHPCPAEDEDCAVVVKKDGIRLIAQPKPGHPVVLKAKPGQEVGIEVAKARGAKCLTDKSKRIQGSLVKGFTVKSFAGDGVLLYCVDNWRVTKFRAVGDNEYGIFPSHVGTGRVDHSFASGANDTGIYIGQSHDVQIDHNNATRNVSGFEIENSVRVLAEHNTGAGNTAGLLSFALPNLDVKVNRHNTIQDNDFHANNKDNTCLDPDDEVCNVPPGSGIILVATDKNLVRRNSVKNNRTGGIALVSYCILLGGSDCHPDIDPNPDNNSIDNNTVTGNGKNPAHPYEGVAADLIWDTTGKGNCWSANTFGTTYPPDGLPSC